MRERLAPTARARFFLGVSIKRLADNHRLDQCENCLRRTRRSHLAAAALRGHGDPTGDEERSLGAGETVLSLAAGGAYPLGEAVSMYGALGYSSATDSGDDGVFANIGVEGRVRDGVLMGVSADWAEASIANAPERTQMTLYSAFDLNENVRLAAYALAGLSDAAPEAGAGLRLVLH